MKPVSKAHSMQTSPNNKLRFRVFATNSTHHPRSSTFSYNIGHRSTLVFLFNPGMLDHRILMVSC
jgi:hypothetical protein